MADPQSQTAGQRGTALVTGGALRIGRALCLALADSGYDLAIHYKASAAPAEETAAMVREKGRRAAILAADLTDPAAVASLVPRSAEMLGPVTLLVNNASVFERDDIDDFTLESWHEHMNVNLLAPMMLAQAFVQQAATGGDNLPRQDWTIVNILDQRVRALTPRFMSYTLSKSALWTATQTLAQSLGPRGIRVNAIGPGPTLRNTRQANEDWQAQNEALILGRGPEPDDIAQALLYLISAKAVTGQMIAVDGGQHLAWETPDVTVSE